MDEQEYDYGHGASVAVKYLLIIVGGIAALFFMDFFSFLENHPSVDFDYHRIVGLLVFEGGAVVWWLICSTLGVRLGRLQGRCFTVEYIWRDPRIGEFVDAFPVDALGTTTSQDPERAAASSPAVPQNRHGQLL